MAVKWVSKDVLDHGLQHIVDNADEMLLLSDYALNDSFAVVDGRKLASSPMAPADLVLGDLGTMERMITVATKTVNASASSSPTPDLHFALIDRTNSKVLAVANETSDQPITTGNPVVFPTWQIRGRQPV